MIRILLLFLALFLAVSTAAEQTFEIIPLRSQTVDRVLPVLLPLVEPGGTLTGANDQLFLRASRQNREDIKRALAAIDRPARRLVIQVSHNREVEGASRGGALRGEVVLGSDNRANLQARAWDNQGRRNEGTSQMVQTVEGGQTFIQVGRSLPIPMRSVAIGPGGALVSDTVVFHDIGRGFFASPRLNGDRVTIDISQQADSISAAGRGVINTQRLFNDCFRSAWRMDRTRRCQQSGERQATRHAGACHKRRTRFRGNLAQSGGSAVNKLKRHIGQKVALATAVFCALLTLPALGLFFWLWKERGLADAWVPSALATVAFLGFCTIVLYVTSRPQPPLPEEDTTP